MRTQKHLGASAQVTGTVAKLSLKDQFKLERAREAKKLKSDQVAHKEELVSNLNIAPVSPDYVNNQYVHHDHLGEHKRLDHKAIVDFITNPPVGSSVGFESYKGLDHVFHLKLPGYEGHSYTVRDIADSPEYQALSVSDKNTYFREEKYTNGPIRIEVKNRAFKDINENHIENIAQNLDKLPEPVRKVLEPYLSKMDLISEDRDIECATAVATHILDIKNYDESNHDHQQRAIAAMAAMREFYGLYHTSTVRDGSRRIVKIFTDTSGRDVDDYNDGNCGLVLGD